MSNKYKIGLCIGGGGTKGVAALPIIESLLSKGLKFDMLSGTSIGAVIAAYLSDHGEVTSLKDKLLNMETKDWLKLADPIIPPKNSIIKGEGFHKFYEELFSKKDIQFSDLSTPLSVATTNLHAGRVEYFESGNLVDALMASSSYPGIFPPYDLRGELYIDGGIFDNLPFERLFEKGLDKVVAINLNSLSPDTSDFGNIADIIARSFDLMMANAFDHIPLQNEKLFVYSLSFPLGPNSMFGIKDLATRCAMGQDLFKQKENDFQNWLES